jgi:hypothetical protein
MVRLLHDWTVGQGLCFSVSQLIELISNQIHHNRLCRDLIHF